MRFKVSWAAYAGIGHQQLGLPCQDAIAVERSARTVCAALADGAGSCASSHIGARCVTEYVSRLFQERFEQLWLLDDEALGRLVLDGCIQTLAQQEPPIREMACTLLYVAMSRDGRYLSGHLGDGVQILVGPEGSTVFSSPENGAYRNETFFLTGEDAPAHLRLGRGQLAGGGALLLMSDGMADSLYQYQTGTPAPACGVIARWLMGGDEQTVSQAILDNMRQIFSSHSADDLSLAAITWEDDLSNAEGGA